MKNVKIFAKTIEAEAMKQIEDMATSEAYRDCQIRIMPDCHAGKGCTVGTVIQTAGKVVPNTVGVDIGCGMLVVKLGEKDINLSLLDRIINESVPSGFDVREQSQPKDMSPFMLSRLNDLHKNTPVFDLDYIKRSLGTLGGGNHFMEYDEGDGRFAFTVHTGSRHLGLKVFNKWDRIAQRNPNAPGYLVDEDLRGYLTDMVISQAYARFNREVVLDKAAKIMHKINGARVEGYIKTTHNYVDFRDMILRKGAIRSYAGELMVVPFNMRDGIVVCEGRSNSEWNFSAPHGSGRCMSRADAKRHISMAEYHRQMQGIYTTSVTPDTLDEAPEPIRTRIASWNRLGRPARFIIGCCLKSTSRMQNNYGHKLYRSYSRLLFIWRRRQWFGPSS